MLVVCVLVSLATILCVWRFLWGRSRYVRLLNRIPGSKGWPIIGNSLELQVNLAEFLQLVHREWSSKYGNIYRGWAGTRSVVCIASPELMEVVISNLLIFFNSLSTVNDFVAVAAAHFEQSGTDNKSPGIFVPESVARIVHVPHHR